MDRLKKCFSERESWVDESTSVNNDSTGSNGDVTTVRTPITGGTPGQRTGINLLVNTPREENSALTLDQHLPVNESDVEPASVPVTGHSGDNDEVDHHASFENFQRNYQSDSGDSTEVFVPVLNTSGRRKRKLPTRFKDFIMD